MLDPDPYKIFSDPHHCFLKLCLSIQSMRVFLFNACHSLYTFMPSFVPATLPFFACFLSGPPACPPVGLGACSTTCFRATHRVRYRVWHEGDICDNWTQLISRCGQKVWPLQYWCTGPTVCPHRLISCVQLAQNRLPYPPGHTLDIYKLITLWGHLFSCLPTSRIPAKPPLGACLSFLFNFMPIFCLSFVWFPISFCVQLPALRFIMPGCFYVHTST